MVRLVLFGVLFGVAFTSEAAPSWNVAYRRIAVQDPVSGELFPVALWYPTRAARAPLLLTGSLSECRLPAMLCRLIAFEMQVASYAPPADGKFGVIVISHGAGGLSLNHRDLAMALASRGYVVAAPTHPRGKDNDISGVGVWVGRPKQVSRVIDVLLEDAGLGSHIQRERIGVVGHSNGGYTALAVAGAKPSPAASVAHCRQHPDDSRFCSFGGAATREATRNVGDIPDVRDPRVRAIVLMAPNAAPLDRGDPMTETSARTHLVAGGFPPGSSAGHDHDYARLRLLALLAQQDVPTSVANDFADLAKWLPLSRLLITYVAGPYPDAEQCRTIQSWLEAGGRWLALHGTSGGRAERVEGSRQRRTVKTEHHALLGSYFLTHPPIQKIQVDVERSESPLTRGLGTAFDVEDEPYFIELQDPGSTQVLLTADYGPGATSPAIGSVYEKDTSLRPDGKTRVLGYTRDVGRGAVAYFALGHCHNPAIRSARAGDLTDTTPLTFRGAWETEAFVTLLRNAMSWGVEDRR